MLALIVQHQPHRAFTHFGAKPVRCLAHDAPAYSAVGASGKPGAVHGVAIRKRKLDAKRKLTGWAPQSPGGR